MAQLTSLRSSSPHVLLGNVQKFPGPTVRVLHGAGSHNGLCKRARRTATIARRVLRLGNCSKLLCAFACVLDGTGGHKGLCQSTRRAGAVAPFALRLSDGLKRRCAFACVLDGAGVDQGGADIASARLGPGDVGEQVDPVARYLRGAGGDQGLGEDAPRGDSIARRGLRVRDR